MIPGRQSHEGLNMQQPGKAFGNMYSVIPPGLPLQMHQGHQPVTQSVAQSRLLKFKRDPLEQPAAGNVMPVVYQPPPANSLPPPVADRNQYGSSSDGRTCTTAPTLQVETRHNAYISHVQDGPYHFIVQLKTSVEKTLPKLRNILEGHPSSPITTQLIPGSVVTAKGSDGWLKRGVIMSVQPETCKVYYIDYGNSEELSYSAIFQLPNMAAELSPAMALQFCLADLKSVKITDANKDYFARLLLGKQVLIRVTERESNSPFQYCEIHLDGHNVREILVNMNSPLQYSYQYPPRGREAAVSVIYVDGLSQFFVQYRTELATVNQIQEALAAYCPTQPRVKDASTIHIGSPVASLFPEDQKWYRALVMGMDGNMINVLYVDYGNRAEVTVSNLCLLSRDLVNKWKTQAIECCLIGFNTVTPDLYMAGKMEEAVLGRSYTLRLHSILSGFRLNVDLVSDSGTSIAAQMKDLLNDRQKHMNQASTPAEPKPKPEKTKSPAKDEDRSSQTSSDGGKRNTFPRPGTRGERPPLKGDRNKPDNRRFEERPNQYSQHDDRSGQDYQQDPRGNWNRGPRKPHMDSDNTENGDFRTGNKRGDTWSDKKPDKRFEDKPNWGGGGQQGEKKFGNRDKFGDGNRDTRRANERDNKFGGERNRENKWGNERDIKFGGGDRDNKFGDREKTNNRDGKFGNRDNKFGDRGKRFGEKENKSGNRDFRDNKPKSYGDQSNGFSARQSTGTTYTSANDEDWDESGASTKRSSVVISEYPHQNIEVGKNYKVFLAVMETSPNDIYVQLSGCDDQLEKIRDLIDADTTATSRPISNPVLAAPVLARFSEDGLLYRATIKSLSKVSSGQVDVLFVDFGNTAVNSLSEVFSISSELMAIPIQAIRVKVTDMPAKVSASLDACQVHFQGEYLILNPTLTASIDLEQVVEGIITNSEGVSVAQLVSNASGTPPSVASLQQQSTIVEEEDEEVASSLPTDATSNLVVWVERLDLLVGQFLRAKVLKNVEGGRLYVKITATLDLVVETKCETPLQLDLSPGEDIIIFVESLAEDWLVVKYFDLAGHSLDGGDDICAICPMPIVRRQGTFCVVHRDDETVLLQDEDPSQPSNLLELLYEKYESSEASDLSQLSVGSLCAAKSLDGNWYRAKVQSSAENKYTVFFLDYGNTEEIDGENVRALDESFKQPEMCFRARLPVKLRDADSCWDQVNTDNPLQCKFIKKDGNCWLVDIFDIATKENLALKFLTSNMAESDPSISADPNLRNLGWDLKKGDSVPIVVTHYESPGFFWAHLNDHLESLAILSNKLEELPEGGDESELGDIFVAKYPKDSQWYRAVNAGDDNVRFIDYGNIDQAGEKKVLPKDMMLPIKGYALPLHLCVKPTSKEWTDEAVNAFDAFIEKSSLIKAEILSVDYKTVVDLVCEEEKLSELLINGNHAVIDKLKHINIDCIFEDLVPSGIVEGFVSFVNSVQDFFIQEKGKTVALEEMVALLEEADTFESCECPTVGSYVVARFPDDSQWYRAQVLTQDPIEVLYVDYGNASAATEFRVMPSNVASFPLLAWRCTIDDDCLSDDEFTSLVSRDTTFHVKFKGKKGDLHVVNLSSTSATKTELSTDMTLNALLPPKLDKKMYKNCCLSHSNGPYDFYVQTDDDNIKIEEMSNALFEGGKLPKLSSVKKGDFIVAQYPEDDAYYRAIVTDTDPEVVVHFVDHGNSCPAYSFHKLPSKLKAIPALALRCSLQSPIGGWSVDAIDKFSSNLNMDTKSFDLKIITVGDPIIVDVDINGSSLTSELAPNAKFETSTDDHDSKNESKTSSSFAQLRSSGVCYVVHVEGDSLYVQDSSANSDIELIAQNLSTVVADDEHAKDLKKVKIGDTVATEFEGSLSRATVSNLDPLEVYFIDYGNSGKVEKVFELPEAGKGIKPLAIKTTLYLGDDVKLSKEGFEELQVLAAEGADYTLVGPSSVELSINGTKIVELLKSHLVQPDEPRGASASAVPDNSNSSEPMKLNQDPNVAVAPETTEIHTVAESKPDQAVISPDSIQPHTSTSLESTKAETASTTECNSKQEFAITFSFVNSPSEFYYQIDSSKIAELSSRLESAETELSPIATCEVGQLICSKYDEDNQWYRSKVLETQPTIEVFFIDYGNSSEVKDMRQLPDDLLKLPPLCFKGSLKPKEGPWTDQQSERFADMAYGSSTLKCSVVEEKEDTNVIDVIDEEVGDIFTYLGGSEELAKVCAASSQIVDDNYHETDSKDEVVLDYDEHLESAPDHVETEGTGSEEPTLPEELAPDGLNVEDVGSDEPVLPLEELPAGCIGKQDVDCDKTAMHADLRLEQFENERNVSVEVVVPHKSALDSNERECVSSDDVISAHDLASELIEKDDVGYDESVLPEKLGFDSDVSVLPAELSSDKFEKKNIGSGELVPEISDSVETESIDSSGSMLMKSTSDQIENENVGCSAESVSNLNESEISDSEMSSQVEEMSSQVSKNGKALTSTENVTNDELGVLSDFEDNHRPSSVKSDDTPLSPTTNPGPNYKMERQGESPNAKLAEVRLFKPLKFDQTIASAMGSVKKELPESDTQCQDSSSSVTEKLDPLTSKSLDEHAPVSGSKSKRPFKSVAEIKASAKPRISTGRSSLPLKAPLPAKKAQVDVSKGRKPTPCESSSMSKEKDRLIPGAVSGHSWKL